MVAREDLRVVVRTERVGGGAAPVRGVVRQVSKVAARRETAVFGW